VVVLGDPKILPKSKNGRYADSILDFNQFAVAVMAAACQRSRDATCDPLPETESEASKSSHLIMHVSTSCEDSVDRSFATLEL
jgi:hypothetical protein